MLWSLSNCFRKAPEDLKGQLTRLKGSLAASWYVLGIWLLGIRYEIVDWESIESVPRRNGSIKEMTGR